MLRLTSVLHSASHSYLHMSSAALSSIHANVRGGWLVLLHPLQSVTSWIGSLVQVCNLSVEAMIDSRHTGPSHCLSN